MPEDLNKMLIELVFLWDHQKLYDLFLLHYGICMPFNSPKTYKSNVLLQNTFLIAND